MSILQLLNQILSILGEVLTILGVINGNTQNVATESAPLEIQSAAVGAVNLLEDPTIGLQGLYNEIVAARSDLGADLATILAAIGNPQQTGVAVTLPSPAPFGYGATGVGSDVWNAILPDGNVAGDELVTATRASVNMADAYFAKISGQPYLVFQSNWSGQDYPISYDPFDPLDPTTILPTDANAFDWVSRAYAGYGWLQFGTDPPYYPDNANVNNKWILDVDEEYFALLQAFAAGTWPNAGVGLTGAPVWPGITGVTLGTPVALTPNLELTQPMHGVVVNISSVAPSTAYFTYGTEVAYRHIGGLAFFDDADATEDFQFLGFPLAVYLPKSMVEAGGVRFNVPATLTGTVTPFTIP